uniref:phage tail tube protein n=1 Tax=Ruegeria arenilitoris TaxID=1173585 RepID=UPI001481376D|nr:phage tail tube protein [Ruegeria arenilitoris]
MSATAGQDAVFKIGGTVVAGVRVSGFTRDATPIDITDKGSQGYQELMSGKVSSATLSMNVEGVEKDQAIRDIALGPISGWTIADAELALANGDKISGAFFLGSYQEGDDYKEATTFSATLTSAAAWTFTPAA